MCKLALVPSSLRIYLNHHYFCCCCCFLLFFFDFYRRYYLFLLSFLLLFFFFFFFSLLLVVSIFFFFNNNNVDRSRVNNSSGLLFIRQTLHKIMHSSVTLLNKQKLNLATPWRRFLNARRGRRGDG